MHLSLLVMHKDVQQCNSVMGLVPRAVTVELHLMERQDFNSLLVTKNVRFTWFGCFLP